MALNKVMLIGNVGKKPDVRYLEGNAKVASLTLATTERYKDRAGNTQESTEWHNIVAWRNLADLIEKYVTTGTQIYVEGRLRTRSWVDQTGNKRYTTEIEASNIQLLGKRSDAPATDAPAPAAAPAAPSAPAAAPVRPAATAPVAAPAAADDDMPSDDLPF